MGAAAPLAESVVEAPNWMAGIKAGRGKIGEPEAIPHGASCTVAPDGRVTVFDAPRRRTYVLFPLLDDGLTVAAPTQQAAHAARPSMPVRAEAPHSSPGIARPSLPEPPRSSSTAARPGGTTVYGNAASRTDDEPSRPSLAPFPSAPSLASASRAARPATMAFVLDGPLPGAGVTIPVGGAAVARPSTVQETAEMVRPAAPEPARDSAAEARAAMRRTMAFVPGQFDLPPLPTREVVVGVKSTASAPRPSSPPTPSPSQPAPAVRVLFEKDVPPSDESPLHYHVVGLQVAHIGSGLALERELLRHQNRVRARVGAHAEGHLVQVFAYRQAVREPGEATEIASVAYRGWRRESHVRFPELEEQLLGQSLPGKERYAEAAADPRLATLLEAFEDIWFLATPREGLEFAGRLLLELLPDVHVVLAGVALEGEGFVPCAEVGELPGYAPPARIEPRGLAALALGAGGRPIVLGAPSDDARVEVTVEGSATGPLAAVPCFHGGEALGYVRVARAKGAAAFSRAEAELLRATTERLGLFLRLRGACIQL